MAAAMTDRAGTRALSARAARGSVVKGEVIDSIESVKGVKGG